jgi:(R,R)-butanediol dehydrogenase/meso-butanediol dehydrogenase/diacetyl reductase
MKAALWYSPGDVRIEDVPEPSPKPGEVKIKIKYAGLCGTDIHEYVEGPMFITTEPHPITGTKAPLITGHEFAGEIVELGEGVEDWQLGDRVTPEGYWICGECHWCQRHQYNYCDALAFHGFSAPGGFAEYVCSPTYQLYRVDDRVSWEEAAMIEPTAVSVRSVNLARPLLGETALVVGAGPIGLTVMQALWVSGISDVIMVQRPGIRLEMAKKLGATLALDPNGDDVAAAVADISKGIGVDMAFECAGTESAFNLALRSTRKGGRVALVGQTTTPWSFYPNDIGFYERTVFGEVAYCGEFATAIKLIAEDKINARDLITLEVKLDDLVTVGYKELMENRRNHIKVIVSLE